MTVYMYFSQRADTSTNAPDRTWTRLDVGARTRKSQTGGFSLSTRAGVARQQSLVALGRGNAVRTARAADKERIRRNALDLAGIVLKPPDHWSCAKVIDVLMLLRGTGSSKAASMCAKVPVSETRRLNDLTFRQRYALAVMIRGGDLERVPAAIADDLHQSLDDSRALCAQAEQASRQATRLVTRSARLLDNRHPE